MRIWGGIHFRNSLDVGYDMGQKIAAYLIDNSLNRCVEAGQRLLPAALIMLFGARDSIHKQSAYSPTA